MGGKSVSCKDNVFPASEIQKMLWVAYQFNPDNPAYNISMLYRLTGTLNINALQMSTANIIRRHHILRSSFKYMEYDLAQIVHPDINFNIEQIDLSAYESAERDNKVRSIIDDHANRRFNLEKGPLINILLARLSDSEHILSIVIHKIIFDTESRELFISELSDLYSFYSGEDSRPLTNETVQYSDFTSEQKTILSQKGYDLMINFWKETLSGHSYYLNLPSDFQRPVVPSHKGERVFFKIETHLANKVNKFSNNSGINLFTILLSIYYILLYRISSQHDIIIGIPFKNRNNDKNRKTIGCFENILPLGITISGEETFQNFINNLNNIFNQALLNQEVPLNILIDELNPKRSESYNPVIQAGFVFDNPVSPAFPGIKTDIINATRYTSQFDIFLRLEESDNSVTCRLEFNSDLFTQDTAETITRCYKKLVESVIIDADRSIDMVPMLSLEDENRILLQWNNTRRDYDLSLCLHKMFELQAEATPDRVAVVFREQSVSYNYLNEQANRIAHELISCGVVPDRIVGVYMERSIEMVISLYAILKAGGAYLPLNPELPAARIRFMAEDAEPIVIITQPHLKQNLSDFDVKIISLDMDLSHIISRKVSNPTTTVTDENLAYCIYTSGSTGKPKGALINHSSICNRILWMQEYFHLESDDRVLQKTPFDFDVSVWEFFWPLINGATLIVSEPGGHRDGAYLKRIITQHQISVVHFVPAMLEVFLHEPDLSECTTLRYVICSGEALSYNLQELFFSMLKCGLYNLYGPTEAAVDVTYWKCSSDYGKKIVPIGFPVANTQMYILNSALLPVPPGVIGDLYIGGVQLSRGYLKRDELTNERFLPNPFSMEKNERLYKTGDTARWLTDGAIEYIGRSDFQIKFNGVRVETGEIEFIINKHPSISASVIVLCGDIENKKLVAYYTLKHGEPLGPTSLRNYLKEYLPLAVIPTHYIELGSFPKTSSGKIDRKALPGPVISDVDTDTKPAAMNNIEKQILLIWKRLLSIDKIGIFSNFFDLGGTSLKASLLAAELRNYFTQDISVVKVFQYPTIHAMAEFIGKTMKEKPLLQQVNARVKKENDYNSRQRAIAVIGMSGRFPGAESVDELWENILQGKESVTFFSPDELDGIDEDLKNDPFYIPARGILKDIDKFDAPFFGISPNEAQVMDPQQRVLLETAWSALEHAGYSPEQYNGLIGVYAGMGDGSYHLNNIHPRKDIINRVGDVTVEIASEKDHIAPRISYLMDLRGPSLSIHTACSTALVVVDAAFNALQSYQCDIAMAGGIDITVPQKSGQLYQEGGIFTKDGHCRPFDSEATGTMFGEASGIVVLKRLEDAIADNDTIHAVILGSAVNHDGSHKASYLAPSVDGQAEVIALAQARADVHPETIGFIEAHGTATPIGDPIEIEGLIKAFRLKTSKNQYCAIGSIKGNLGHTTNAAGITGLIKTINVLKNKKIPPSINFNSPNPQIDFKNSPFFVNTEVLEWPADLSPARAGVSAFGYCGTNAHVVLEEFKTLNNSSISRSRHLIVLSAKTAPALKRMTSNFKEFLKNKPDIDLADAAYTLQKGRNHFSHRKYFVCSDVNDLLLQIDKPDPNRSGEHLFENSRPEIVFMFPGQGSQYVNMGKSLYRDEPLYRDIVDSCALKLKPYIGIDIRELLFPDDGDEETALISLKETKYTQPAIFITEYALSQLWISWGIKPDTMIGHSIGEFVCACLAGVFTVDDALKLVAARGQLMQELPRGTMLSVLLDAASIEKMLPDTISLAAVNGPNLCVVSGPIDAVTDFEAQLNKDGIVTRELHSSHAFHSIMMDSIVKPFEEIVRSVKFSEPSLPFISTVTGKKILTEEVVHPYYWANHLRATVKFSNAIYEVLRENPALLLEVGPRSTSATLARQHITEFSRHTAIPSLSDTDANEAEWTSILKAVGMLWQWGINIDWDIFYKNESRRRISLPTYSFEKLRYWVDPPAKNPHYPAADNSLDKIQETVMTDNDNNINNNDDIAYILIKRVCEIMEDISGKKIPETAFSISFVELGFDSLILTQIARNLTKEFKTQISFRHLIEKYSSITLLAEYIQTIIPTNILENLSPEKTTPSVNKHVTDCRCELNNQITNSVSTTDTNRLENIIIRQMNLIERLVTLLEKQEISAGQIKEVLSEETEFVVNSKSIPGTPIAIKNDIQVMRYDKPPIPGARLGKDENGNPAWYIPDPLNKGKYQKLDN